MPSGVMNNLIDISRLLRRSVKISLGCRVEMLRLVLPVHTEAIEVYFESLLVLI